MRISIRPPSPLRVFIQVPLLPTKGPLRSIVLEVLTPMGVLHRRGSLCTQTCGFGAFFKPKPLELAGDSTHSPHRTVAKPL